MATATSSSTTSGVLHASQCGGTDRPRLLLTVGRSSDLRSPLEPGQAALCNLSARRSLWWYAPASRLVACDHSLAPERCAARRGDARALVRRRPRTPAVVCRTFLRRRVPLPAL